MQAIILAAGMGKRLQDLTLRNTKCMIKVNGISLIERMLLQLDKKKLSRIILVVGYQKENLINYINKLPIKTDIIYIENSVYYETNNIYSLYLAKDRLIQEDTLLLESDLIFENAVLDMLLEDTRDTLALVDKYESWMDGTVIKIGEEDTIIDFIPGKKFQFEDIGSYYKTVNIYKFSQHFSQTHYVPFLEAYSKALGANQYYEQVLRVITMLDTPIIKAKRLNGESWYEIDDIQDLDIASSIFASDNEKLTLTESRYGGYWRYPKLIDFCYLVNPYFPCKRLKDEIKVNFDRLIEQYPSGMRVNSLLASKNFGVKQKHIIVGNGAAELIKSLMMNIKGKTGVVRPTFEEYPNRLQSDKQEVFYPKNDDFSYSVDDLITYFDSKMISSLILINPDNPTGHYIPKKEIIRLLEWSAQKNINLILDESFADFSDELDHSFVNEHDLLKYPNLIVVKSISKSYGVPGLRLGVIVSSQEALIATLKKDVAIWNINSFAEFYMQIEEKYQSDYLKSLKKFRCVRTKFLNKLRSIDGLSLFPTQANYVMIELTGSANARSLTEQLLCDYTILIKDLSGKIEKDGRQFIRIAIRTEEENTYLAQRLSELLSSN